MDEEIAIIDSKTRNEKIKFFFINNRKLLISIFLVFILSLFSFFIYQSYQDRHKVSLANKYNKAVTEYENGDKSKIILSMKEIIKDKDSTYSPLGLYFLIDNDLIDNRDEVNNLFDIIIKKTNLEFEIKNLIIYKKALINSDSIWKSHALYLMAEYFYSKN